MSGTEVARLEKVSGITRLNLITNDETASFGPEIYMRKDANPAADSDALGAIFFNGKDSGNNDQQYGLIYAIPRDVSSGAEDGSLEFDIYVNGSNANALRLQAGSSNPQVHFPEGSESEPSIFWAQDIDTGCFASPTSISACSTTGHESSTALGRPPRPKAPTTPPEAVSDVSGPNRGHRPQVNDMGKPMLVLGQ